MKSRRPGGPGDGEGSEGALTRAREGPRAAEGPAERLLRRHGPPARPGDPPPPRASRLGRRVEAQNALRRPSSGTRPSRAPRAPGLRGPARPSPPEPSPPRPESSLSPPGALPLGTGRAGCLGQGPAPPSAPCRGRAPAGRPGAERRERGRAGRVPGAARGPEVRLLPPTRRLSRSGVRRLSGNNPFGPAGGGAGRTGGCGRWGPARSAGRPPGFSPSSAEVLSSPGRVAHPLWASAFMSVK